MSAVIWQPTMEFRWRVSRPIQRITIMGPTYGDEEKVLQQKFSGVEHKIEGLEVLAISYCEWREVPTVKQ